MSSIPPVPTLVPGQILDRYELLCPVAQGGMAQVWVARQRGGLGFQKLVAVKTVVSEHAHEERFISAFLDEARIISGIRHPNVAQILDLGQRDEALYLVLEWIDGDSVAALRRAVHGKSHKLPLNIVLRIVADACAGLHAAHELKNTQGELLSVVHRDVSPSNVLMSMSGEIKVIDFGVAKAIDRVSKETAAGVIKGKVAYMSPEQALGKAIDRRADLWSCGVMLYHLLAGKTPYEAGNQIQTLHRIVQGQPPDPLRGVQPEVAELAYTALSYDPNGRFATADEMHRAVETVLMNCCGPTTQSDVSKYVEEQLADRLLRRRKTIQRALEAAENRRELHAEFETAIEQSSSSIFARELRTPSTLSAHSPYSPASSAEAIDALLSGAVPPASSVGVPQPRKEPAEEPPPAKPPSSRRPRFSETIKPQPMQVTEPIPETELEPAPDPNLQPTRPPPFVTETQPSFPSQPLPLAPRTPLPPPPALAPLPDLPPVQHRIPARHPQAKLPPLPTPPTPPVVEPLVKLRDSAADTETTRRRPPEPRQPAISVAADPPPRMRMITISDVRKFGTRKRGPMILLGFAMALALLGYGAYLAWERFTAEQNMQPLPPGMPTR